MVLLMIVCEHVEVPRPFALFLLNRGNSEESRESVETRQLIRGHE